MWSIPVDRNGVSSGVGVRFLALASEAAQHLERFVYERTPGLKGPETHSKEV